MFINHNLIINHNYGKLTCMATNMAQKKLLLDFVLQFIEKHDAKVIPEFQIPGVHAHEWDAPLAQSGDQGQ